VPSLLLAAFLGSAAAAPRTSGPLLESLRAGFENPAPAAADRVDRDLAEYDQELARRDAEFARKPPEPADKVWVKAKLRHMTERDQFMRNFTEVAFTHGYDAAEKRYFWEQFEPRFRKLDGENTEDLKSLLALWPWFTISEFGRQTAHSAWLLAQHADKDIPFQKSVLAILGRLYPSGEVEPAHYAYLHDRVAMNEKRPQRFATQGSCVGPGRWEPNPCEDLEHVDARRAAMGLETLAEYKERFKTICR
jgi:hypothetical protein